MRVLFFRTKRIIVSVFLAIIVLLSLQWAKHRSINESNLDKINYGASNYCSSNSEWEEM